MMYNFNRVSDRYDEARRLPPGVADRICRWVLSRLSADPLITEIGVGTGRIAIPFIKSGTRYTGVDISDQMLKRTTEKLGGHLGNARLMLADVTETLPLRDHSQDAVIAVHILHLVEPMRALTQVRRILKQGGALVWGYQHHGDLSPRWLIRKRFFDNAGTLGHIRRQDFHAPMAREILAEWGARVTQHTIAAWTEPCSCGQVLADLQNRTMSGTWEMEDTILAEAIRRTATWVQAEFGDLDRPYENEEAFMVDWHQF